MKRSIFAVICLLIVGGLGAAGYQYKSKKAVAPTNSSPTDTVKAPATIEFSPSDLMVIATSDISRAIPITGSLKPVNQALVKAKIAGELQAFKVREGMPITAGQVIAQIDASEAQSRLSEREAQLRSVNAQVDQAKRTAESNKVLLEKNFISQNAFDLTRSNLEVAIANRDAIAQQIVQSKKALADTRVLSPINGVVSERFVQPGEKLGIDARIVSIVDLSQMEIEAPVPSSDIAAVAVGQSISLQVEGVAGAQVGKVSRISPSTQAGTRSVIVYVSLANKNPQIRAGMFAQGALNLETKNNIVAIPLSALRESAGRNFVYVVSNNQLLEREVKLGLRNERASASNGSSGIIEITQGLKTGDEIVALNLGPLAVNSLVAKKAAR
jgi:membrane fusion protein, multidrug efflux system